MSGADVIVVGGGFAGLSAATALAEEGARVVVVEARRQLGGRATAHRDPVTGERIDNGQHLLAGCYDETLRFLRRIGSAHALHRPSTLEVRMIDEDGVRHELRLPPLPSPLHLVGGVLAWRELTWRERAAILRLGPVLQRLARGDDSIAADETVHAWLLRHHQPARLCSLFWEPLALAALNQSIHVATAAAFMAIVARMLAGGNDAASLLIPATLLDDLYANPAEAFLRRRGSQCLTGRPARVRTEGTRVCGVQAGKEFIPARTVISSVAWFDFADTFDRLPAVMESTRVSASNLLSSPIVTVNIWLDRAVMTDDFIGLPGRAFQWVFDKGRIVGEAVSHLSLVSSGADSIVALDNDALCRRALDELASALPAVRAARVRRMSAVRERRATFSLAPGMPPRPSTRTALEGLLLAGDWIDTGLPATIEGAVVSGHRAARIAIETRR